MMYPQPGLPAQPVDQTPIPCRRCGAAMRESGPARLVGPVEIACPYCGMRENLPEHQAQRVMALRARLAQLRAAKEAEEAPALAYARMMQMFRGSYGWILGAFGAYLVFNSLYGAYGLVHSALTNDAFDPAQKREVLGYGITYPAFSLGVAAGVAVGYIMALRKYKRAVEPRFRARAPMQEGQPARCRSCGANLPITQASGAFVKCNYCAANNLVTRELANDRIRILQEETREHQQAAAGVMTRVNEAVTSFQTYFYIGGGIALGLSLVLGIVAHVVLAALIR